MRGFIKGVMAGTMLGVLAGAMMRPGSKPNWPDLMNHADAGERLGEKAGKAVEGMARSVDRIMK